MAPMCGPALVARRCSGVFEGIEEAGQRCPNTLKSYGVETRKPKHSHWSSCPTPTERHIAEGNSTAFHSFPSLISMRCGANRVSKFTLPIMRTVCSI